jgi:hypothetical protein
MISIEAVNPIEAMKILRKPVGFGMASCQAVSISLLLVGSILQGTAQIITLSDNNSIMQMNTGSGAGVFNWYVDGVNQLKQIGLYYRIGSSGPESSVSMISAPSITLSGPRQVDALYANANLNVDVLYLLTGNSPGSGNSLLNSTVTIKNNNAGGTLDLHFFQYVDVDLGGITGGQSDQFTTFAGRYNKVTQTMGALTFSETFSSLLNPPSRVEANTYNNTLASLLDGSATMLSGATSATGDVTACIEWDVVLAPAGQSGDSLQLSQLFNLQVPEPSFLALVGTGAAIFAILRRRRTA